MAFPDTLELGTGYKTAKNHALCNGAVIVAKVQGGGYPIGEGWAPHTEALAAEIAKRFNTHRELLAAAKIALEVISEHDVSGIKAGHQVALIAKLEQAIAKAEV